MLPVSFPTRSVPSSSSEWSTRSAFLILTSYRYRITPENAWGTVHGLVGLGMVVWWQLTLPYVQMGQTH